jgi:hypothetical protein
VEPNHTTASAWASINLSNLSVLDITDWQTPTLVIWLFNAKDTRGQKRISKTCAKTLQGIL